MRKYNTYLITITGLIQGVGFRPFVHRLAVASALTGWVNNTNVSVQICVNCRKQALQDFIRGIHTESPPASKIESLEYRQVDDEEFVDFRIIESEDLSDAITEISPDIAVCSDCLEDMKTQPNRMDYPFLNCTNCGPRFTIVRELPYDRGNTTMQPFEMCESCASEYGDVLDRRFHAQPTACCICGPEYELWTVEERITVIGEILETTARLIDHGGIVSIKGLGGFFMACDALNEDAVRRMRDSKHREGKPFAVMFRSLKDVKIYCHLTSSEGNELSSWRRPIVILNERKELAPSVSNGFSTIGAMLPYMPFHYLLFSRMDTPAIVLTSGNLSDEPILMENKQAEEILGPVSGAVLGYNRDIHNRCDDSVVMVISEQPRLLRRSRGYVPNPIRLDLETEGIFAAGAELVNCFCMGKGEQAILSQHIGDLKNFETYEFYRETFERFSNTFRLKPSMAAHDLHPDYLSTRFALDLELPAIPVQHHHAHIASVMAEHKLDEKIIGVSFDGTGLGDDGNIWGSEFLVCDLDVYERITHLAYMPMPGGDLAAKEPWRMAVSLLYSAYGKDLLSLDLSFLRLIPAPDLQLLLQAIEKGVNCPLTSGAGRLFDAVAAMLDLCQVSLFHAEAPMRLENIADMTSDGAYPYGKGTSIDTDPIIRGITDDILMGRNPSVISGRFHQTISEIILDTVTRIREDTGINKVALSGGTFQNRLISTLVEPSLQENGFQVYVPMKVPANDGGIALGQLAIAAKRREMGA